MPHKQKKLILILRYILFLSVLSSCNTGEPVATPPNVVILLTDDQGYGDLSSHGHPFLKTPNMDELRKSSLVLTNFHVAPACTPTRSQLMTGVDGLHNGAISPHGQYHLLDTAYKILPEYFLENGYNTALYGKWHLGGNSVGYRPHERGFQDAVYFLRGGHWSHPNPWNIDCMDDQYYHNGVIEQFEGYATDIWFDLGKKFVLQSRNERKPFFLYLAVNAPHIPWLVPEKYREPYLNKGLDKESVNFYAMLGTVDERLGDFVDFLKEETLWENTIFIFMSDNGTALRQQEYNAGLRGKKASPYEGGHHVPFFMSWPGGGFSQFAEIDALTQIQDLLPTLINLCGFENDLSVGEISGMDLSPLFNGKPDAILKERILVAQLSQDKYKGAVMWNKWRLVNGDELYDLDSDPAQEKNLFNSEPDVSKKLKDYYDDWWHYVPDKPAPYFIGHQGETEMLTAYDWYQGRRVFNWPHLRKGDRSNGLYRVVFVEDGTYSIALRRWPKESGAGICERVPAYTPFDPYLGDLEEGKAFDIRSARIKIGDQVYEKQVEPDDKEARFNVEIESGETTFQTWFVDSDNVEFGAFYVYIERVD